MKRITATIDRKLNPADSERGVSLVITLMVMAMLLGFVAMALTRVASEARVASNDSAEARTLAVSEAGLEDATRDFASLLENKISPTDEDLTKVKNETVDQYSGAFEITKSLKPLGVSNLITIQSNEFQGLYSLRDEWQIDVTAHEYSSDVKVQTMRRFYNNRIPLFQFGAFFQDDLELNRPPLFALGGKVHTNGNLFVSSSPLTAGGGIFFKSKVTVSGEIVNNIWKTGTTMYPGYDDTGDVFFPDASGNNEQLTVGNGSVNCTSETGGGGVLTDPSGRNFPYPTCTKNPNWLDFSSKFEGNLQANTPKLRLPVDRLNVPLIEMIRRGKNIGDKANVNGALTAVDDATKDEATISKERYANKSGIRVSLADSRDKLPGCAAAATNCGVQLDAKLNTTDLTLGYQPVAMTDGYKTTAVNGNRLAVSGRQTWIKIDMVSFDYDANVPVTTDITQDFLSLGMTEPLNDPNIAVFNYASTQDSRSIIKIQHFVMPGPALVNPGTSYVSNQTVNGTTYNFVSPYSLTINTVALASTSPCYKFLVYPFNAACNTANAFAAPVTNPALSLSPVSSVEAQHYKLICFNSPSNNCGSLLNTGSSGSSTPIVGTNAFLSVPFPIQMYDSREGNRADSNPGTPGYVRRNGVMSMIDIDVANLRKFFAGTWDGKFPTSTPFAQGRGGVGLKSTDVPNNRGWVFYVSDRRGDYNFDGRYDMEDTNPGAVSLSEEDLNNNGAIDIDINNEAPAQDQNIEQGLSAVTDHQYYRRGVRLINARQIPGKYDSANPNNSLGFTFASENGIYVKGNYNVQSVALPGGTNVADSGSYLPQNTTDHIPASIVGDSVMVLSNGWNDANSFVNAFDTTKRLALDTQVRFAMITGDSLTARNPGAYGDFGGLNGGLHNIFRFLERWRDKRLNYSGSIVNLYNSYNNNGKWKCCTTVYDPPIRDWTFDSTFTDPNRLPPGAPFVYYITFTGFQRVNP